MSRLLLPLLLVLLAVPAAAQTPSVGQFQVLARSLRTQIALNYGIDATGPAWAVRKVMGDVLDLIFTPQRDAAGGVAYHPFNTPELSCFARSFYLASLDTLLAEMDAATPRADGVNVYYVYGSGVIAEAFFPDSSGALKPLRIAVDVSDVPIILSGIQSPGCISETQYRGRMASLANRLDAYFITHFHEDHVSPALFAEMNQRGKPILVPQQTFDLFTTLGGFIPSMVVIAPGNTQVFPNLSVNVFSGNQGPLVENNVYTFDFDVPVAGSTNGISFVHFGDQDGPGLLAHLTALDAAGGIRDNVITANDPIDPAIGALLSPSLRIQSPTWEFLHFINAGAATFGMNIPSPSALNPSIRYPFFWGEGGHFPSEF